MIWSHNRAGTRLALTGPLVVAVLAATAIPVELGRSAAPIEWTIHFSDFWENVIGFVPVGMAFAGLGFIRALAFSTAMSVVAETSQIWMVNRSPQPADVAANVIGAICGTLVCRYFGFCLPSLPLNRKVGVVAAALAILLFSWMWITSFDTPSQRGLTVPGTLEAAWRFDESNGRRVLDTSGQNIHGDFEGTPVRVPGMLGGALRFADVEDHVDFGRPNSLRLQGSMTIAAWINASAFYFDDAAIVSQFEEKAGWELDTTRHQGRRFVGFKLTNVCGQHVVRYGATPLDTRTWYHVAGVYDASAQTVEVYLNGKPDNGALQGRATASQISSHSPVYVGRRGKFFDFPGIIDDVQVYSAALTQSEIASLMEGKTLERLLWPVGAKSSRTEECAIVSDSADAKIPGAAALLGVFAAAACLCLLPTTGAVAGLLGSFTLGMLLYATRSSSLPSFNVWMLPLVSLIAGFAVLRSRLRAPSAQDQ